MLSLYIQSFRVQCTLYMYTEISDPASLPQSTWINGLAAEQ